MHRGQRFMGGLPSQEKPQKSSLECLVCNVCCIFFVWLFIMGIVVICDLIKRDEEKMVQQNISNYPCLRNLVSSAPNKTRILSTCSDPRTWYQSSQNVVTFSYYNVFEPSSPEGIKQIAWYKEGLLENLRTMRQFYPGYTMRIYTNASLTGGTEFCEILSSNSDVHWCDIRNVPGYGNLSAMYPMTWRFLPLGDSTVDVFLSRDMDSIITEREAAVVQDWLNSTKERHSGRGIHLMRDHPSHNYPILGGIWGASNEVLGKSTAKTLQRILVFWSRHLSLVKKKGFDQSVLNEVIFVKKPELIVAYDSYHCLQWGNLTENRPFPVKRKNAESDFVGNPNFGRGIYQLEHCPVECRPSYAKNWAFC